MTDASRVLVVEDDPEIRYLLTVVLGEEGHDVRTAATGVETRQALTEEDVDLVILDLILPDVDGRTLLAGIRSRPETADLPVVIISARGGNEIREDCYDLGADYFAEKPFDADVLVSEVSSRLERAHRRESAAVTDPATGLATLAALQAGVPAGGYTLALVQIDGYAALTERWGWADGEEVMGTLAPAFRSVLEGRAAAGRVGGGEFAFVVPASSREDPSDLADRLLAAIRGAELQDPEGAPLRLTASVGLVGASSGTPLDEAFDEAHRRIFHARRGGGDRIVSEPRPLGSAPARLLVAEDDEISATILMHRLQKDGLEIVRFDNGRHAYQAALEEVPDLVILDVKMPGMDGFEVLERLRDTPSYGSIPIILLTSMGSEADVVRGFQLGADDYILKPFSPVELSARVWRLLRRGRSRSRA